MGYSFPRTRMQRLMELIDEAHDLPNLDLALKKLKEKIEAEMMDEIIMPMIREWENDLPPFPPK